MPCAPDTGLAKDAGRDSVFIRLLLTYFGLFFIVVYGRSLGAVRFRGPLGPPVPYRNLAVPRKRRTGPAKAGPHYRGQMHFLRLGLLHFCNEHRLRGALVWPP